VNCPILIAKGLFAPFHIDDGQTAMGQTDPERAVESFAIGTAMGNRISHIAESLRRNRGVSFSVDNAGNSTHIRFYITGRINVVRVEAPRWDFAEFFPKGARKPDFLVRFFEYPNA
jgi:hypothetical protein